MEEWIKKSDAIKAIISASNRTYRAIEQNRTELTTDYLHGLDDAITIIKNIPSADRPQGEWRNLNGEPVPLDEGGCPTESAWCSECGTWLVASDEYSVIGKFCPNCGARMKGADDD